VTSSEELRRQDKAISFYKNRLDLALAHQKEMTTLFFKVTIGYFTILYGVFLIYQILYETHSINATFLKEIDFSLYRVLVLFSVTFLSWGIYSLTELFSLDSYVIDCQKSYDKILHLFTHNSTALPIEPPYPKSSDPESYPPYLEYLEKILERQKNNGFREITFKPISQKLFQTLALLILLIPIGLGIYSINKISGNILLNWIFVNLNINELHLWIVFVVILVFGFGFPAVKILSNEKKDVKNVAILSEIKLSESH
jgi:hypothetical protein